MKSTSHIKIVFIHFLFFMIGIVVLYGIIISYKNWLAQDKIFEIRQIEITGNDLFSRKEIMDLANLKEQDHILNLNLTEIEKVILTNPFIESVQIKRILPDILDVQIFEKQAVALLRFEDKLYCVDREGLVLPSNPGRLYDLPVLSGDFKGGVRTGSYIHGKLFENGLNFLSLVFSESPDMYSKISEIIVQKDSSLKLYTYQKGVPVILGHTKVLLKIRYLEAILHELEVSNTLTNIKYIDLRYDGQVVLGMRS